MILAGVIQITFSIIPGGFFVALCAVPSFLVAIALLRLPESPRFLLSQGKVEKAISVLKKIHRENGGKAGSYPVTSLISDGVEEREATNEHKDFKAAVAEVVINGMPG